MFFVYQTIGSVNPSQVFPFCLMGSLTSLGLRTDGKDQWPTVFLPKDQWPAVFLPKDQWPAVFLPKDQWPAMFLPKD